MWDSYYSFLNLRHGAWWVVESQHTSSLDNPPLGKPTLRVVIQGPILFVLFLFFLRYEVYG